MKFAKLFDLEGDTQVLVTLEYDEDNGVQEVMQRTEIKGFQVDISAGKLTQDSALIALVYYGLQDAKDFREMIEKFPQFQ